MTFGEAEEFFKKYDGHAYHMWHDEPKVYKEYCRKKISKKQENIWRLQKIEEHHERIQSQPESAWVWIGRIIGIMHVLETVSDELLKQLLDALEQIGKQDIRQRILVMEDMAGRKEHSCEKSGYALYTFEKKYYEILHDTMARVAEINEDDREEMERLSASNTLGWNDAYYRYLRAAERCESVEKRLFSGENLKSNRNEKKAQSDKKYNYYETWLALDEE